jgi:P2-related tail formation protein
LGAKDSYTDEEITYELYELKHDIQKGDILFNEGQHELGMLMRDH